MKKLILYINQFFAGVGGEDMADYEPELKEGAVGPGALLQSKLQDAEIIYTIICGDNFMNSHKEEALRRIKGFLEGKEFDMLIAGPAFASGRYGMSCGAMCQMASSLYHVPVVTCMNEENPGVDAYRSNADIYILKGNKSAAKMRKEIETMANFINKLLSGEKILWADAEGYFGHGLRRETFVEKTSADRVVDMLLKKLQGEPYVTEYPIEIHDTVAPAKPVTDIKKAKLALVTTGGLVPTGNPDRLPSGTASVWMTYPIEKLDALLPGEFFSVHGGYDTTNVNTDPEVLMPLASVKEVLHDGEFGELEPFIYTTTGNLTALKEARRMGHEIGEDLKSRNVDAVLLVST